MDRGRFISAHHPRCPARGSDVGVYHVGHSLREADLKGAGRPYAMTTEAVVAKAHGILGRTHDRRKWAAFLCPGG